MLPPALLWKEAESALPSWYSNERSLVGLPASGVLGAAVVGRVSCWQGKQNSCHLRGFSRRFSLRLFSTTRQIDYLSANLSILFPYLKSCKSSVDAVPAPCVLVHTHPAPSSLISSHTELAVPRLRLPTQLLCPAYLVPGLLITPPPYLSQLRPEAASGHLSCQWSLPPPHPDTPGLSYRHTHPPL